jgi:peptidoglycan hydrolase CwlO-like protein
MSKLVLSALVASGLTLTGVGIYALKEQPNDAQTQQQQMEQGSEREADMQNQIRGEVTNIADHTIEVKDETGKTHSFDVTG